MTDQIFIQPAFQIKIGGLALAQFGGNETDFGKYRGKVVPCNVLKIRSNELFTAFLVELVENPAFLAIAKYAPELYERGVTDSVLHVTNACITDNSFEKLFLLGEWDRIKCTRILSYYF
jgi:hypothetical protein